MKPFRQRLDELWEEARTVIIKKVKEVGKETKNYSFKTIKLDDDRSFNLNRGYATEIGKDSIINSEGNLYGFNVLDYEQLLDIADWLEKKFKLVYYQPKFEDEMPTDKDGIELFSFEVYRSKENCKEDFPDYKVETFYNDEIEHPTYRD